MGLLGSGLRNGSPFYPGYEYTEPELTAPTGLLTLAGLMSNLGTTAGISKKTKGTTDGEAEITSSMVPGTKGTRNTIIGTLSNIDASIEQVKSKIRQNFDKDKNATPELAVAASSELAKQLGDLMALKNKVKGEISVSNQNLVSLENAIAPYKEKDKAWTLGEMAMKEVNGLYIPVGSDDGENALTYGDVKNKAYEANNTYVDTDGVPRVKLIDYSGLSLGASQAGALDAKVTKVYKDAEENQTAWGDLNVVSEGDLAGFIKGYKGSNNDTQLLTVATVIKSKLEAPEKADLAAQTVKLAQNEKLNATEIASAGLTDDEIYALKKSVTDTDKLTDAELMDIAQAQAKVLAAKVKGDIGLYRASTFTPTLRKGLYGEGKYDKTKDIESEDSKAYMPTATTASYLSTPIDVKSWDLSSVKTPLTISVAAGADIKGVKGSVKGGWVKRDKLPTGTYNIQGYEEAINPETNTEEQYVLLNTTEKVGVGIVPPMWRINVINEALSTLETAQGNDVINLKGSKIATTTTETGKETLDW